MKSFFRGQIIVVGNNIDTDQIYPGHFLALTDPKEIASHCLAGVDETIAENFPKNGLVVAGKNFGCGSSREHAPIALINMGASAIIADSFARIFYRNSINLGMPLIVCKGISQRVADGQNLSVDIKTGTVTIEETGEIMHGENLSNQAMKILEAGGIKPLMKARMAKLRVQPIDSKN
ncbi:MAG: 3-isopropylmalate dehydratase [Lactobacillus sp.]|jgi:3-isopropylmalate dehydratase small subunit|nr:3-isopropylmalate dehydratase [Lactobacillus sp.]MCI2031876.1 3-isopropylmalate dehydratase [Lactobacillus sp.]